MVAARERPQRIFEALTAVVVATGAAQGTTRRALDSTILDDAVARQEAVTQLIAAIRQVARQVPGGRALVNDALVLLDRIDVDALSGEAAGAVALLALVAGQDVEPAEGSDSTDGRWRIARKVAPDRVISTVDPKTRHARKTRHRRQDETPAPGPAARPDGWVLNSA